MRTPTVFGTKKNLLNARLRTNRRRISIINRILYRSVLLFVRQNINNYHATLSPVVLVRPTRENELLSSRIVRNPLRPQTVQSVQFTNNVTPVNRLVYAARSPSPTSHHRDSQDAVENSFFFSDLGARGNLLF